MLRLLSKAQITLSRERGAVRFAEWLFFFLAADYFMLRFPIPLGPSDDNGEMDLGLPFWAPAAVWLDSILQIIAAFLEAPFLIFLNLIVSLVGQKNMPVPCTYIAFGLMQILAAYFYAILLPRWWARFRKKPGDLFARDNLPTGK